MQRGPVLAIDVDSTIYHLHTHMNDALEEMGEDLVAYEHITTWNSYFEILGKDLALKCFEHALRPSRVNERRLYRGVQWAMAYIGCLGYKNVFLTHNHDPDSMRGPLTRWLREMFGPEVGVCVLHGSQPKVEVLQTMDAVGIVDDAPHTLEDVADAGMFASTLIHPWNREVVERRGDVHGFKDWRQMPMILAEWAEKNNVKTEVA